MVLGLKSLNRKLTKTIPEKVRKAAKDALAKGAEEIVEMARRLVPVDQGDLRDSIGWTFGEAPKGSIVLAQSKGKPGDLRVTIFAGDDKAFYARWVEFGTQNTHPQPYFFPSYRFLKRRVKSRVTRSITKAIKDGAK